MALIRNRNVPASPYSSNTYLSQPSKGLSLVSSIVSSKACENLRDYKRINHMIDEELLSCSTHWGLKNELDLYSQLAALSDRLVVPAKYRMLKNRSIVGIGGKFSAGKSLFINSLLGHDFKYQLPVSQSPSTSVPTYIVSGNSNTVLAYTVKGAEIELDEQALSAISHDFKNTYGLGLAQYLSFISISAEGFEKNIALLDTPGYNKADSSSIDAYSDKQKAYSQLRSIDYLIWLMDVQNGTLTEDDISFIGQLNLKKETLIVINKCDLKMEEEVMNIVNQTKADVKNANINVRDVVPYSSMNPSLYDGREKVRHFLQSLKSLEPNAEDVQQQIQDICNKLEVAFESKKNQMEYTRNRIGSAILTSKDVFEVRALVAMYGNLNSEIAYIKKTRISFEKTKTRLLDYISQL